MERLLLVEVKLRLFSKNKAGQVNHTVKFKSKILLLVVLFTAYFGKSQTCSVSAMLVSPPCPSSPCNGVVSFSITGTCNSTPYFVDLISGCITFPTYTVVSTPTVLVFNNLCPCSSAYNFLITDNLTNYVSIISVSAAAPNLSVLSGTNSPSCGNSCTGSVSANFFGATPPYTIAVNPPVAPVSTTTSQYTLNNLCSGIYTLNVSDANSCAFTFTRSVNTLQTPTVTAQSGSICSGQTYTIAPSGALTYTYLNGGSIVSPTATSAYSVIGTNSIGCSSNTAIVTVSVNPNPSVIANSLAVCNNQTLNLTVTATLANTFNWTGPNGFTSNQQNPSVINPVVAYSGTYSVLVTSTAGCTNTAACNVTVTALPTISLSSNSPVCAGNNLFLTGNVGATQSYTWSGPNNFVSNTSSVSIISSQVSTTGTYTLSVTDGPCALSKTITVSVNPIPTIAVQGGSICQGQSFTLNPAGANSYTFLVSGPVVSPTVTSGYTVTGVNLQTGCTNSSIAIINVTPLPLISVAGGSICSGQSFTLNPSGANSYTYSLSGPVVSPTVASGYTISGISLQSGCTNSVVAIIHVNPLPLITTGSLRSLICVGEATNLFASGANTYTWNTGISGTSLAITPTINTTYSVTGTDSNGCTNTAVITQSVDACLNIKNEELKVKNYGVLIYPNPTRGEFVIETEESASIKIYNSLGQFIMSNEINDGKNSTDLSHFSNGIYFIEVKSKNGFVKAKIAKE